ncbi:MAG: hypothetical protein GY725_20780 [bacterium]|nr:hypothetical protein [bacterium]
MTETTALDERILEKMPYPLAHLYQEMLDEKEPRIRFRGLIKVFAGGLKYLSLICIADYMVNPDSERLNAILSQSLKRPSLGHWMHFLRSIVKYYSGEYDRVFHVEEIQRVLDKRTNKLADHMIHLRNTYVHPDILPDPQESRRLYDETLPHLRTLLTSFKFVADYPLIRRHTRTAKEAPVMGNKIAPTKGGPFQFLVRATSGDDLDITPFMLITVDEDLRDLLVYETLIGNRAKYIMGNHMQFVAAGEDPNNRVRLLQQVLDKFASQETEKREKERSRARAELREALSGPTFHIRPLRALAAYHSEQVFEEYKTAGRYDPRTYVSRQTIVRAYEKLLNGDKNALVIVADSGVGKSTEICHLYLETFKEDVTWIISGRRIRASQVLLEVTRNIYEADEQGNISHLLAALNRNRTNERFVILFDGINETDDPVKAFQAINNFVETHPYSWLKVVITSRSFAWKTIDNSGILPDKRRFVLQDQGGIANTLEPFNDSELAEALERYSLVFEAKVPRRWTSGTTYDYHERKLLRSPLILRFIFEAFTGRVIPAPLNFEIIMREFTAQRLRADRDLPFLQKYLMAYFFKEETDTLDTSILLDAASNEYRGISDPDDRTSYRKLVEHICGEQVYYVDEIWLCPTANCLHSNQPIFMGDENNSRCPRCKSKPRRENVDNRSTYSRLLSENILSQSEHSQYNRVRLVFDRYFEYLMGHFCFVQRMQSSYIPELIDDLFNKTNRNGIFLEPLKSTLVNLWNQGERKAVYQIANKPEFAAYHVLRELLAEFAEADFQNFSTALQIAVNESAFNANLCRAGVHALLVDTHIAGEHVNEIVELLVLLSRCKSEEAHDEIGQYLISLRRRDVDLITPLVNRCGEIILAKLNVFSGLIIIASEARRQETKGLITLFLDVILFGLGNFYEDSAIRGAVTTRGLAIVQRLLRHPLLSLLEEPVARFVARRVTKIYKEKGPLPCNYFEMLFQLRSDPETIRRTGDLFFVERQNLFHQDYDSFRNAAHSENGLVNWCILSLLPIHYLNCASKSQAISYMKRVTQEGSEMDRYMIGDAIAILLRRPGPPDEALEDLLEELGQSYLKDPRQIFVHPEPTLAIPEARAVVAYNSKRAEQIRSESNPYMPSWIALREGKLHRFYINSVVFHYELLKAQKEQHDIFHDILTLLDANRTDDLLNFGDDIDANRDFVISFLIQSLEIAAILGFLKEVLNTVAAIIHIYIETLADPERLPAYRFALAASLKTIKEYHRPEVLAFLDRYDLDLEAFQFLEEVATSAEGKEKLFSKSVYGHNIYQGAFASQGIREAFGEFTKRAADARDVEEFFLIYARAFTKWFKNYSPE